MVKTCYFKRIINERILAASTQNINMKACLCMFTHTHIHKEHFSGNTQLCIIHYLLQNAFLPPPFYSFSTFVIKVFLAFMPQD